ncbi:hypothetical protein CWI38_0019p0080 [Hamiltosporidium tvaerminnensis]|uniref:Uncharacterized protein n=1 Tax=Hamiltosporidium tvaerminnensis TaxID=1176355 RepID=A0A4Q9L4K5_9MICR|nr:hypothetical protein LUQ84_003016 [Hamiltosporidium tvaerminnensis]TBU02055.1 hypothetical protein CWI37_0567p0020 [Hamiltosporidium tvaerminnensis]TBU20827.1 hypothetical protein CWI38_0019p0080 [Hamiltosporidium tvaerminnensis]
MKAKEETKKENKRKKMCKEINCKQIIMSRRKQAENECGCDEYECFKWNTEDNNIIIRANDNYERNNTERNVDLKFGPKSAMICENSDKITSLEVSFVKEFAKIYKFSKLRSGLRSNTNRSMFLMYLIVMFSGFGKAATADFGHYFGHGGISHGDSGHYGYDIHGGMGGVFANHRGKNMHKGDSGLNGILFTRDVVHHGDGSIFVSMNEGTGGPIVGVPESGLTLDQIHEGINRAINNAHDASIAKKDAEKRAEELKASIAQEQAEQQAEEAARLKELDDKAAMIEHEKPEVLGKRTIPIVNFTEESIPLMHHMRELSKRIDDIRETEAQNILAQQMITRLDDMTDAVPKRNVISDNPDFYKEFEDAGNVDNFKFHVPVTDNRGSFYIKSDETGDHSHSVPMRSHKSPDGHSHWVDHGELDKPQHSFPISPEELMDIPGAAPNENHSNAGGSHNSSHPPVLNSFKFPDSSKHETPHSKPKTSTNPKPENKPPGKERSNSYTKGPRNTQPGPEFPSFDFSNPVLNPLKIPPSSPMHSKSPLFGSQLTKSFGIF